MIPQYLIVDTEEDAQRLTWVTDYFPLAEGEAFRTIMECLSHEANAIGELEVMERDIDMRLRDGGYSEYAFMFSSMMLALGKRVFSLLKHYQAYHNGVLLYHFHEDVNGALVLRSYESADFNPADFVAQLQNPGRSIRRFQ